MHEPDHIHERDPRPTLWFLRTKPAAVVLAGFALLAAACGGGSNGPGVAQIGSGSTTTVKVASQSSKKGAALAYSRCMRAHGIHDFPDPNSSGGLQIQSTPGGDLDPNSPQFTAAQKACEHFMSGFGKGKPSLNSRGAP